MLAPAAAYILGNPGAERAVAAAPNKREPNVHAGRFHALTSVPARRWDEKRRRSASLPSCHFAQRSTGHDDLRPRQEDFSAAGSRGRPWRDHAASMAWNFQPGAFRPWNAGRCHDGLSSQADSMLYKCL